MELIDPCCKFVIDLYRSKYGRLSVSDRPIAEVNRFVHAVVTYLSMALAYRRQGLTTHAAFKSIMYAKPRNCLDKKDIKTLVGYAFSQIPPMSNQFANDHWLSQSVWIECVLISTDMILKGVRPPS